MEIRPATFDDVDAIRELMVASMSRLGPGFYTAEETAAAARYLTVPDRELIEDGTLYAAVTTRPSAIREDAPTLASTWEATPKDSFFTVLSSPPSADPPKGEDMPWNSLGSIVGVGGWSLRLKLFTGSEDQERLNGRLDPGRDSARIRAFFVASEFARRGIGRRLYEACASAAREAGFRSFSLMATLPGVPLYRALGFGDEKPTVITLPDGTKLPCVEMAREI